jgi:polyhydroxybutyrate depolymerase
MNVGGQRREYRLVVPTSVSPTNPAPLVFAFHGLFDSKDLMPTYTHLDDLAAAKGFILVYPNGQGRSWPLVPELTREDLAFFDALYTDLTRRYNIDLNRCYLVGMSNGAYFTHLVATQRSEQVAAIAVHSGGLGLVSLQKSPVPHKYPVLIIHGNSDRIVAVSEGRKARDVYQNGGHEVEYLEVPGLHHGWAYSEGVNDRIWAFFLAHPRH